MPQAVILAGGQGERFWPLTHRGFPKYRVRLDRKQSLLQKTYRRLLKIYPPKCIHVVTTREHLPMIRKELPALPKSSIFTEPFRKNTAAAIFLSCFELQKKTGGGEVVSFFPADHLIQNGRLFKNTMRRAIRLARDQERLVTIGIHPTFPATGYGYIQIGKAIAGVPSAHEADRFVEKPNRSKALDYLRRRKFLWNGGIFTWRIRVFMDAMKRFSPALSDAFQAKTLLKSYRKLEAVSIDVALLEKAGNVAVLKTSMDWCDMGSWDRLFDKSFKDESGNVVQGPCFERESKNSFLSNHRAEPLVVLGAHRLIVVQTAHGTLVAPCGRAEEAALLLSSLRSSK